MAEKQEKRSKVGISEPTVNYCAPLHSCEPTECTTSLLSLSVPPPNLQMPKVMFPWSELQKMDFSLPDQGKCQVLLYGILFVRGPPSFDKQLLWQKSYRYQGGRGKRNQFLRKVLFIQSAVELSPKKSSHNLKIFAVQAIGVESWEIFHESSGSSPSHYMGK